MSDDLISRKAVLKELREIMDEPYNVMFLMGIEAATAIIEHMETAFDKEQVINEIRSGVMAANDEYIETCNEYYHGMQEAHKIDWRIVEKGGIG